MNKKIFFHILLIVIPFIAIGIIEGILILFDYGTDYPLFYEDEAYYKLNRKFPEKYFSNQDIITPELIDQKFPKSKNNVIRLVCLGGSTTAGFPYEENINFPYFLRNRLEWLFPDKKFEVLNLGISAINSHAIVDFVPEVIELQPDVVLIYMGHNEFYGALGLASVESIGSNRDFIKLYLWLKELRIYQLLRSTARDILTTFNTDVKPRNNATLMESIIDKHNIGYKSDLYNKTLINFELNLDEIIRLLSEKNIPVLLSSIVSNVKDQFPLGIDNFSQHENILEKINNANLFMSEDNYQAARLTYEEIISHDSTYASVLYNYANCLYRLSEFKSAKNYYQKARDYDTMRFRAPSEFNSVIKKFCSIKNTFFVDSDSLFNLYSENGIPGKELFLEHLHPNVKGYFLIASAFTNSLKINSILCNKDKWPNDDEQTMEQYLEQSGYTLLDIAIGELTVEGLVREFPFNGKSSFKPTPVPNNEILNTARAHRNKKLYWDEAHYKLGKYYETQKEFGKAQREYEAVVKIIPDNYQPYIKLGDLYFLKQDWQNAISYYSQGRKYHPNSIFITAKMGKTYIIMNENDKGIKELEKVLSIENKVPQLKAIAKLELYYLLGLGYARLGNIKKAKEFLNTAINMDSDYLPAKNLLQKIK